MAKKVRGLTKSLHSPDHQALCNLLIAARQKAGLTQQTVAKRLKRPQSFVAKVEGGERRLDILEYLDLLEAIEGDPIRVLRSLIDKRS